MSKDTKQTIKAMAIMASIIIPFHMLLWVNMFKCYGYEDSLLCLVK